MSPSEVELVRLARDEFLNTGQIPDRHREVVRPEIVASWARSRSSGASPEEVRLPSIPEFDEQSVLRSAADPVLSRLAQEINDLGAALFLANDQAQLVRSWIPHELVRGSLKRILAEPGASCSEAMVGTNGIGTALADGRPKIIGGPEHWGELHLDMTCVAAPVLHPISRRPAAVINVTMMRQRVHPALTALVRWGVDEVRRCLHEQNGRAERALIEQFMAQRRTDRPSLLLSPRLYIADPAAAGLLPELDAEQLWERLGGAAHQPRHLIELELEDGAVLPVRVTPLNDSHGLLVEIQTSDRPPRRRAPGRPGASAAFAAAVEASTSALAARSPLLLVGEPGTGKATLAARLAQPGLTVAWFDGRAAADSPIAWCAEVRGAAAADVVVLRHLDQVGARCAALLDPVLAELESGPLLVATAHTVDDLPDLFARFAGATVAVPALRDRTADLPTLVTELTVRLNRQVRWSPQALDVLARRGWPGNVRELENVVQRTLSGSAGLIRVADLPLEVRQAAGRRRLTRMERTERDTIMAALETVRGSKVLAAEELGISRSSLYRKIQHYGLVDAGQVVVRRRS